MNRTQLVIFIFISFTLTSCINLKTWQGKYRGFLQVSDKKKKRVQLELVSRNESDTVLNINDEGKVLYTIPIQYSKLTNQLQVNLSGFELPNTTLHQVGDCFSHKGTQEIRICKKEDDLIFDIYSHDKVLLVALIAYRHENREFPILETPRLLSYEEGRNRIININFDSQLEFENDVQSRLAARKAMLNLVPRVSLTEISAAVSLNILSIMHTIGDLVPFLFPSRWYKSQESKLAEKAQHSALLIVRANLILQFEGFYHSFWQAQESEKLIDRNLNRLLQIKDQIAQRNSATPSTIPSLEPLEAAILLFESEKAQVHQTIDTLRTSLSLTLGFKNPDAVITIDRYPYPIDIEATPNWNISNTSKVVLDRSLELSQIETLIQAAQVDQLAQSFAPMDPASSSVGLDFGVTIEINKSQIKALEIKKKQITSQLLGLIKDNINELTTLHETYSFAKQRNEIRKQELQRSQASFEKLDPDRDQFQLTLKQLVTAVSAQSETENDELKRLIQYSMASARHRRLLFGSGYDCLANTCHVGEGIVGIPQKIE